MNTTKIYDSDKVFKLSDLKDGQSFYLVRTKKGIKGYVYYPFLRFPFRKLSEFSSDSVLIMSINHRMMPVQGNCLAIPTDEYFEEFE